LEEFARIEEDVRNTKAEAKEKNERRRRRI